ncbi:hypothetical protein DPMN_044370 [Dreissena polymorpha]|uniref:Uncharacterized protein n=1 Tax=Dreissena polymorpha TaxID=45954 RepID=A0A9D4D258_DREPO|nr:hypothetical protein DPMN_044370 [Dreissena polymorpha]
MTPIDFEVTRSKVKVTADHALGVSKARWLVVRYQSLYIGYLGFLRKIGLVANGRHIALYYYFTTQKVVSLLL